MGRSKQQQPNYLPSLLIFGPQGRLSSEDLAELRTLLTCNSSLADLLSAAQDLHKFWSRVVYVDPELARVPGDSYLHGLSQWLTHAASFPFPSHSIPFTLSFLLNLLIQITQYLLFLQSIDNEDESNIQDLLLERLGDGGVQGFCVGFLSAICVASSSNKEEIFEAATRALRLAVFIGAYVDKDAAQAETRCLSVRGRQSEDDSRKRIAKVLQAFPKAYVSAFTGETSVTITTLRSQFTELTEALVDAGLSVHNVPVNGRLHCPVYVSEVERLVETFQKTPDLRFPVPTELRVPVRSAADGKVIKEGDVVRHVLENTLLKPVEWYTTVKLAVASLPPRPGRRCIALAGISHQLPLSLTVNVDVRYATLHGLKKQAQPQVFLQEPCINGVEIHHTPPHTPPGTREYGDITLEKQNYNSNIGSRSRSRGSPISSFPPHSVAIVGMAGRFPGANSVEELWELLSDARSMVVGAPDRVGLDQLSDSVSQVKWWGNFLDDCDSFDHKFFNKSAREALATDPQQRILLEVVYEALESAGHLGPDAQSDSTDYGCYIGAVENNYVTNVSCHQPTAYATTGTGRAFLSGAVSHHFGWTGPALSIDTACSSSLVAIHTACRAIAAGECSRAVAGGTNVITSPHDYRDLKAAGFLSPTGQCKPFDAGADGYCRGEAVCVVVLKSLAAAVEENDDILGVIVGSAISQNDKQGPIVVPNSKSQASLLRKVMNMSNIVPEDITYVEAHGTGTDVGDPIEVSSLREAFCGPWRTSKLHFASIKGNIGHTEAASGAAGLIKSVLMMRHGKILPQASYRSLNPKVPALEPDRMAIPLTPMDWDPAEGLRERIACVNNYGAAGSNAAVIIREAPALSEPTNNMLDLPDDTSTPSRWPLIISASTRESLSSYSQKLLTWLRRQARPTPAFNPSIADILFNLSHRANHDLSNVVSTTVSDLSSLESVLSAVVAGGGPVTMTPSPQPPVILVFGGQEGRYVGLSQAVYGSSRILRHHLDCCHDLSVSLELGGIYPHIFQQTALTDYVTLHLALFALQYACAKAWMDCGLKVGAVVGHSFGQLTAICVSGVLSLPDALKLVAGRAALIEKHWGPEPGAMIALQADEKQVSKILEQINTQVDYAEIACFNGPRNHVVVGSLETICNVEAFVSNSDHSRSIIRSQRLDNTHGFHSRFTEPLLPHLAELADELDWREPTIHLEVCSDRQTDQMPDKNLVVQHLRRPVHFQQAVQRLMSRYPQATWLEAGRGSSYTRLVRGCAQHPEHYSFLSPQLTASNAQDSLVDATIELWKKGHGVQFWAFQRSQRWQYRRLALPAYQFQKPRHWLPYIGAAAIAKDLGNKQLEQPKDPEMISLVKGDRSTEAVFRISSMSKRFQSLVMGHVMCGHTVMPASAYVEVASRAALMLQGDLQATNWTPVIEELEMRAPVVSDSDQVPPDIIMTLKRLENSTHPSWSFFFVVTRKDNADHAEAQETTAGHVYLLERDNSQAMREFGRLDALIGRRRWEQIMDHPDAEGMNGRHIYRAFSQVVEYSDVFMGIKTIASLGSEAAGTVKIWPGSDDPPDQRLTDTPMIDSFMQFGGFLVNYFNQELFAEDLFVCHSIQHFQFGPAFSPDAGNWSVLANTTPVDKDNVLVDVYVFEAQSEKMVVTSLGMGFTRMSRASLARLLGGSTSKAKSSDSPTAKIPDKGVPLNKPMTQTGKILKNNKSKRADVIRIAADIADMPEDELSGKMRLSDIGVDSLGATEMISDITTRLDVTIDLATFLNFEDINAIVDYIDGQLGLQSGTKGDAEDESITNSISIEPQNPTNNLSDSNGSYEKAKSSPDEAMSNTNRSMLPTIVSIDKIFDDVRLSFDELGATTQALEYWSQIYPDDSRLVMASIVEAFQTLGCDLQTLKPGQLVPEVTGFQPRHQQLVHLLYQFLEEENIIKSTSEGRLNRTHTEIETTSVEVIFNEVVGKHPHNAAIRHLLHAVGPHLAACLVGDMNVLQILFGNRANKKWLDEVYRDWPMLVTATKLLGDFLCRAFTKRETSSRSDGPFRILEVGAGTGGTTRHIVNLLTDRGIPFEYHFTDISATLVQKARTSFRGTSGMSFGVMDIEKEPEADFMEAFHVILSTNCVHATKDISYSLANLRKMLRQDGALALIEMTPTRPLYVFDIVVGLLEGWWLFEDGRKHALGNVELWEQAFTDAGFRHVLWSDGQSLEARTVRVICGFQSQSEPPRVQQDTITKMDKTDNHPTDVHIQELVYKTVGSQEIQADIYCPLRTDPAKKMPIALMIHGGSHVLFSRKDIRPPQTRIMLEMGLLPVSLDHRLCPETRLVEGPMVDVCDAIEWAREMLPHIELVNPDIRPDPDNLVVVGWSSGGHLALSTGWTAPERGLRPPNAILAFYCPTDYEDEWWRKPIQPIGAVDQGQDYDVLEAVQNKPITNYSAIGAWEPLSNPRIHTDARARIVLHMNWKAQTLPVVIGGLPSRSIAASGRPEVTDWNALPQPPAEEIQRCSPHAQVRKGNYKTPTFLVHGTADDLIPWQQSLRTIEEMKNRFIDAHLVLVPGAPHICDASRDPTSAGWQAVLEGYQWLEKYAFSNT